MCKFILLYFLLEIAFRQSERIRKSCKYYPVCICAATKGERMLTHKQAGVNPIKVTQPLQNLCDSATLKHQSNTYSCVHWCTFQSHSWGNRVSPPLCWHAAVALSMYVGHNHQSFLLKDHLFCVKAPTDIINKSITLCYSSIMSFLLYLHIVL